jgi:hypothetical protein
VDLEAPIRLRHPTPPMISTQAVRRELASVVLDRPVASTSWRGVGYAIAALLVLGIAGVAWLGRNPSRSSRVIGKNSPASSAVERPSTPELPALTPVPAGSTEAVRPTRRRR